MKRYKKNTSEATFDFILGFFWNLINRRWKIEDRGWKKTEGIKKEEIDEKWKKIEELMELGGESRFKQAVIEADKLFDHVLKQMSFRGETFADRLRAAKNQFSANTYDVIWQAHKIRNQITHEIGYELLAHEAKEAIGKFEKGIRELSINI